MVSEHLGILTRIEDLILDLELVLVQGSRVRWCRVRGRVQGEREAAVTWIDRCISFRIFSTVPKGEREGEGGRGREWEGVGGSGRKKREEC